MSENLNKFLHFITESLANKTLSKIILSNKRDKQNDLNTVYFKPIFLKNKQHLNIVFRYHTKDVTKNLVWAEASALIENLLTTLFMQGLVLDTKADAHLLIRKDSSSSFKKTKPSTAVSQIEQHDKVKNRLLNIENNVYLKELGLLNASGNLLPDKQKKFRQINKYIEIVDTILQPLTFQEDFTIVDMGAGKGYLTFALYDYFQQIAKKSPRLIGVEIRKELVDQCNIIAEKAAFQKLKFVEGSIQKVALKKIDVLIALHACDTATDDAIYRGLKANAKVIICAPCCHKQIRKQLEPPGEIKRITQFGILKERQAELITDALRALYMEAYGYKTKVFEFIETAHTPKNVLIVGVKHKTKEQPDAAILNEIEAIKKTYGIEFHYLEKLLQGDKKYFL